jgi:hypothetical protein
MSKIVGYGYYETPGTVEAEYTPYVRAGGVFGQEAPPLLQKGVQQTLCEKLGGVWNVPAQQCVQPPAPSPETLAQWKKFCESAGLTWDPVNNKCLQSAPPNVLTPGAMACQAAGGTWNATTNQCMGLPPPAPQPPPQQKQKSSFDLRALAVLVGAVIVGAYVYKEYGPKKSKPSRPSYARNVYKAGRHFAYAVYTKPDDRKPTYHVHAVDAQHAIQQAEEVATEYGGTVDTREWYAAPDWMWA